MRRTTIPAGPATAYRESLMSGMDCRAHTPRCSHVRGFDSVEGCRFGAGDSGAAFLQKAVGAAHAQTGGRDRVAAASMCEAFTRGKSRRAQLTGAKKRGLPSLDPVLVICAPLRGRKLLRYRREYMDGRSGALSRPAPRGLKAADQFAGVLTLRSGCVWNAVVRGSRSKPEAQFLQTYRTR